MPYQPPASLPSADVIRQGIASLEAQLQPVTPKHAKVCLAKLTVAFEANTKLSAEEAGLRTTIWLEANGDMPDDLWAEATMEAIRSLKWMPKPAEFRELADPKWTERRRMLERAKRFLEDARPTAQTPNPFVQDPLDVRLRGLRDSLRKIGRVNRAAGYERQLAEMENRAPEDWATEVAPEVEPVKRDEHKPAEPSPAHQAAILRTAAAFHRREGRPNYAEHLEQQANKLHPLEPQ